MTARELPHETHLLLAARGALDLDGARREHNLMNLRLLSRSELSSGAGPAWHLLRGAASAYASMSRHDPLAAEITAMLRRACDLAQRQGVPERVTYTGGALLHFERPDA